MLDKKFKFRKICLRNIGITGTLLKKGATAGLNLAEIGLILCRPDEDDSKPSLLEEIVDKAESITKTIHSMKIQVKKNGGSKIIGGNVNGKKRKSDTSKMFGDKQHLG
jgi:hypothetical protein